MLRKKSNILIRLHKKKKNKKGNRGHIDCLSKTREKKEKK
jgi:hypothetical protein